MIRINIDKAKSIAHDIRRTKRADEFAPYDKVIAMQIPGTDAAAVEAERQAIRERYAVMQTAIDAAQTPEEIKGALNVA